MLHDIATSALAAKSWRVEGASVTVATTDNRALSSTEFRIARQGRSQIRVEIVGANPVLILCDGQFRWTYNQDSAALTRSPATAEGCAMIFFHWESIADGLASASVIGTDSAPFQGRNHECTVVRAEYDLPGPWPLQRTFCIDPVRRFILRDQTETGPPELRATSTITYTVIERDPLLPAGLFQADNIPGAGDFPSPRTLGSGEDRVYHVGEVSAPVPIQIVKPSYTDEARQLGISGTVEVSVQIDKNGIPSKVTVIHGLGHGLDEKAIEAVKESRFRPTLKDGQPVVVETTIGMFFEPK